MPPMKSSPLFARCCYVSERGRVHRDAAMGLRRLWAQRRSNVDCCGSPPLQRGHRDCSVEGHCLGLHHRSSCWCAGSFQPPSDPQVLRFRRAIPLQLTTSPIWPTVLNSAPIFLTFSWHLLLKYHTRHRMNDDCHCSE